MVVVIIPVHRFSEITDNALLIYAQDKVDQLTKSSKFPASFAQKDAVIVTIPLYQSALSKAVDGTKAETQNKNDMRDRLERELTYLGWVCSILSITDIEMYLESGFDYRKKGDSVDPLVPTGLKASEGVKDASILLTFTTPEGARSFVVQMSEDGGEESSSWKDIGFPTGGEFLAENLQKGKNYWFRVAAVYATGLSDWSNPVARIVV